MEYRLCNQLRAASCVILIFTGLLAVCVKRYLGSRKRRDARVYSARAPFGIYGDAKIAKSEIRHDYVTSGVQLYSWELIISLLRLPLLLYPSSYFRAKIEHAQ